MLWSPGHVTCSGDRQHQPHATLPFTSTRGCFRAGAEQGALGQEPRCSIWPSDLPSAREQDAPQIRVPCCAGGSLQALSPCWCPSFTGCLSDFPLALEEHQRHGRDGAHVVLVMKQEHRCTRLFFFFCVCFFCSYLPPFFSKADHDLRHCKAWERGCIPNHSKVVFWANKLSDVRYQSFNIFTFYPKAAKGQILVFNLRMIPLVRATQFSRQIPSESLKQQEITQRRPTLMCSSHCFPSVLFWMSLGLPNLLYVSRLLMPEPCRRAGWQVGGGWGENASY